MKPTGKNEVPREHNPPLYMKKNQSLVQLRQSAVSNKTVPLEPNDVKKILCLPGALAVAAAAHGNGIFPSKN
jgi:hypothetical protein